MTALGAAVGITDVVCIADVGALSANADSASAKPKHTDVIVLIKIVPPVCIVGPKTDGNACRRRWVPRGLPCGQATRRRPIALVK